MVIKPSFADSIYNTKPRIYAAQLVSIDINKQDNYIGKTS